VVDGGPPRSRDVRGLLGSSRVGVVHNGNCLSSVYVYVDVDVNEDVQKRPTLTVSLGVRW
jgi:hypothetical protein